MHPYNYANQLISDTVNSITSIYTYDANGNQTQKYDGTSDWYWTYDYENRQVGYDAPGTTNDAAYTYNAGGARISKTVNSVTETYLLDGANVIVDYDGSNNVSATYLTPFLDQNLLVTKDSNTYYYMQDGLGSVRNLVDTSEVVQNSYDYYAFGESLSTNELINNRYRFTAREWDSESSTYHYRSRSYNPSVGRFSRRDSIEYLGGLNLYSYVKSNPVNSTDPDGFCGCPNTYETNSPAVFTNISHNLSGRISGKKEPSQEKIISTLSGYRLEASTPSSQLNSESSPSFPPYNKGLCDVYLNDCDKYRYACSAYVVCMKLGTSPYLNCMRKCLVESYQKCKDAYGFSVLADGCNSVAHPICVVKCIFE